jgi:hypothetical protein
MPEGPRDPNPSPFDPAQPELLLKDVGLGKVVASAQKAEAAPIVEVLKPVAKRPDKVILRRIVQDDGRKTLF